MMGNVPVEDKDLASQWPKDLYETLTSADVKHMAYVPDAGHTSLINLFSADPSVNTNVLTTEEEGIAIACGATKEAVPLPLSDPNESGVPA